MRHALLENGSVLTGPTKLKYGFISWRIAAALSQRRSHQQNFQHTVRYGSWAHLGLYGAL